MIWWFVSARKWFKGPKVNINHLMMGEEGNVIEGAGGKDLVDRQSSQDTGKGLKD
jgi:hypothetical protein